MTPEEFNRITANCQPHQVFNLDWSCYTAIEFAEIFLPDVGGFEATSMQFYDGAELLKGIQIIEKQIYNLTQSAEPITLIAYSYPKGVAAERKKDCTEPQVNELCIFIEVSQNDDIEVYFKSGITFYDFLDNYFKQNKLPGSASSVESTIYKTNISKFKAHFNRTIVHYNLMDFALKTIGIGEENTYQNNYKDKLQKLLAVNNIAELKYSNNTGNGDSQSFSTITVMPAEGGLNYSVDTNIGGGKGISALGIRFENTNTFIPFVNKLDQSFATNPQISQENGSLNNEVLKQLYNELNKVGIADPPGSIGTEKLSLVDIARPVFEKLNNPFYSDVKLLLKISLLKTDEPATASRMSGDHPVIPQIKPKPDDSQQIWIGDQADYEVMLDITVTEDGKISIKHSVSDNYLKESPYWTNEIEQRGMNDDISLDELRQQVIDDFVAEENEKSFNEKFISGADKVINDLKKDPQFQKIAQQINKAKGAIDEILQRPEVKDVLGKANAAKDAIGNSVANYVEGIQSTQKVVKHIWSDGTVNESIWWTNAPNEEHSEWPDYITVHPLVGGGTDGVIDEIVGIPMAAKSIYEIATDPEKREGLKQIFTTEGITALAEGLKKDADEIAKDGEKLDHFVSKSSVSAVSMMSGAGLITKAGKMAHVMTTCATAAGVITNPKVLKLLDRLKTLGKNGTKLYKQIKEFLEKIDPKILDKLADAPGFEKVIADMAQNWHKFKGGKFVLEYAAKMVAAGKIIKFEVDILLSDDLRRIYDLVYETVDKTGNKIEKFLELKSWSGFFRQTVRKQFPKDLEKMETLESLKWIFNKEGVNQNIDDLRKNIISALKKEDGTPADELTELFSRPEQLDKFRKLFEYPDLADPQDLINKLNEKKYFDAIFEIVE